MSHDRIQSFTIADHLPNLLLDRFREVLKIIDGYSFYPTRNLPLRRGAVDCILLLKRRGWDCLLLPLILDGNYRLWRWLSGYVLLQASNFGNVKGAVGAIGPQESGHKNGTHQQSFDD